MGIKKDVPARTSLINHLQKKFKLLESSGENATN